MCRARDRINLYPAAPFRLAARIVGEAEPGEVLASSTVRDLTAGSGITFEERGEHSLRGVPGTWRLYAAR